jgi:hypothetical protein
MAKRPRSPMWSTERYTAYLEQTSRRHLTARQRRRYHKKYRHIERVWRESWDAGRDLAAPTDPKTATSGSAVSIHDRYDASVADLATQNIPVHYDTRALSAGDAWCDHSEGTDGRIAVIYEPGAYWHNADTIRWHEGSRGGQVTSLRISYPYWDTTVADAIVEAFKGQGFDVEWSGNPENRVIVHLGN